MAAADVYKRQIAGLAGKLTELESLDELNYLSELLKMQFDDDREKFVAAMAYGDHTRDLQDIINLAKRSKYRKERFRCNSR